MEKALIFSLPIREKKLYQSLSADYHWPHSAQGKPIVFRDNVVALYLDLIFRFLIACTLCQSIGRSVGYIYF